MSFFKPTPEQRVVDAATGEILPQVIEADPVAGRVRRFLVEDGILVRDADGFVIVEEERPIRIEVAGAATGVVAPDAEDQA